MDIDTIVILFSPVCFPTRSSRHIKKYIVIFDTSRYVTSSKGFAYEVWALKENKSNLDTFLDSLQESCEFLS